ncbi:male-specific histamine-binding salivary protein-like isoform X1 [Dermacentor silvarum]|uniref:male-specific histamine-binding salivary protein-like isoform X1 n=1 Tax=Dermacentor silvarum TaxID=543639 RepID=UPI002100FB09|nr:male-specific histamine-binding salivary protein-like isoform X1 [Dermacentor silvarum]
MHYFVLLFLFHTAFSASDRDESNCPIWANQQMLQKYQDVWTTLNQSSSTRYFLMRSTYQNNTVWGEDFKCVNAQAVKVYQQNKTVEYKVVFKNKTENVTYNYTVIVGVATTYGYTTPNALQYFLPNETTINDTVIFTDARTCNLLNIPYENDGQGCELWVNEKYLDDTPTCCHYLFDLFCASVGNYTVYDKDECADVLSSGDGCR